MTTPRDIVAIPGDGIGPEVLRATQAVLEAAGAPIIWHEHHAGVAALANGDDVLPDRTIESIREHKIALKGPCTTPVGKGFSSVNVQLRKALDLYAAVRPVRSLPGVKTRYENIDLVIIRENTEGLYSGVENVVTPGTVMSMKVATVKACSRISEWAFDYARKRDRKKVTVFHKANIMKLTDGLFISESAKVADTYSDIAYEEVIIDAGCMKMVQDPTQFDMLLLENLYGDVVSDLCAGLVGGLGVVPGANISSNEAVFEAVHGSAPDIAGKDIANPLALIMSAVMMLNYLADTEGLEEMRTAANRIKSAYNEALEAGDKTHDLGGEMGTTEFTEALCKRITSA
jgi:isocitrate dehydrogenase (NAD+)